MFPKILMISALIAIAILLYTEKGEKKILSGYYKLDPKEQQKWDIAKIRRFILSLCIAAAFCVLLALIGDLFQLYVLRLVGNLSMILLGLFAIIRPYTGNRFKR